MKKIIIIGLIVLSLVLVGCNQKIEEAKDREQYCLDRNMTFDNTYVLQPNWTRCCKESRLTDDGMYKTDCKTYQFNRIENNETEKNESFFVFSNKTIGYGRIAKRPIFDWSKKGYIKIIPSDNATRLIYLECVNSTLKISNNMLYCEKSRR